MAKIPRFGLGERASAVPKGPLPDGGAGAVSDIFGTLAKTASGVAGVASDVELQHAKDLRDVLEARQAIDNEVTASGHVSNFEQYARQQQDVVLAAHPDKPEEAMGAYRKTLDDEQQRQLKDGGFNGEVGLGFARGSAGVINASMDRMYAQVRLQQTQRIKNTLTAQENQFQNDAADLTSTQALEAHLAKGRQQFGHQFPLVYGAEASKEWDRLAKDSAAAFVEKVSRFQPEVARAALAEKNGVLTKTLPADERKRLSDVVDQHYTGLSNTAENELGVAGLRMYQGIAGALRVGSDEAAPLIGAQRKKLLAQKDALVTSGQFGPEERASQRSLINLQLRTLDSLDRANRTKPGFIAKDDIATISSLMNDFDSIVVGQGQTSVLGYKKSLSDILEFNSKLASARERGRITPQKADVLGDRVARVTEQAVSAAEENTGHPWFFGWQDAEQVGNQTLNQELSTARYKNLPPEQVTNVRLKYAQLYGEAHADAAGKPVPKATGRQLALQALSIVTEENLPGVWK